MTRLIAPTAEGVRLAAGYLRSGQLVAFPTETVYGLGGVATWSQPVAAIYAAKGRPTDNPLIWHVPHWTEALPYTRARPLARDLFAVFSPGPLTVVMDRRDGGGTLAVRVPGHDLARRLLEEVGLPVAAPSANRSGRPSPTRPEHVLADLADRVAGVLDGGPLPIGIESTVVDATGPALRILRPGAVTEEMLAAAGFPLAPADAHHLGRSPGTRYAHYQPRVPVVALRPCPLDLVERWLAALPAGAAVVAPFPVSGRPSRRWIRAAELAQHLYAWLRELEVEAPAILVVGPEAGGIGRAVWDRLARAAAGRVYDGEADPAQALAARPNP